MNLKLSTKTRSWSSLRFTLFVQVALLVSLTVFLMVVTAFLLAGNEIRRSTFDQLRSLVAGHESLLETILTKQREQVAIVAIEASNDTSETIQKLLGFETLLAVSETGSILVMNGDVPPEEVLHVIEQYQGIEETALLPVITSEQFSHYIILSPRRDDTSMSGHIAAVFDARVILSSLFGTSSQSEQVSLVIEQSEDVFLLTGGNSLSPSMVYAGKKGEDGDSLAQRSIHGEEFEIDSVDYANIRVFAVSRIISSVGWGLLATVDRYQTYIPIWRLALTMFGGGLVIVLFSIVIVGSMSRRITAPLLSLKQKLAGMETKKWNFERTVFTGNELEVVDQAAFVLANRLKESYEHLEEKVRARTQQILEKNAQDDAIFGSLLYGLLVTDRQGKIVLLNEAGSQLTGWQTEEVRGMQFENVLPLLTKEGKSLPVADHPLTKTLTMVEAIAPVLDPGYSIVQKSGSRASVYVTTAPIMKNGACHGSIALFRDVTEDRRIDQMKSQFISLASHQLRTPLSSIRWYVEMLLGGDEGALDEEKEKSVQEIGAANDRMIRMVTSLLHVANLELGTFTVHDDTSIDIVELIRKIEKMFLFECKTRNIKLREEFDIRGPVMEQTDPELLELVLQNIISNAIKYSHENSDVILRISDHDGFVKISIEDHGIGIPKKDQSKIFEKLFRSDNARDVDTDGNGLGLYIAKIAADALKATVKVESEEGKGTTFTITF